MADIFVAYSRSEEKSAAIVCELLELEGWDVFWDREIQYGEDWNAKLESELTSATIILCLWSERAVTREFVLREAHFGANNDKLIGLRLEPCQLPSGLARFELVELDYWQGEPFHREFQALLQTLRDRAPPSRIDEARSGFKRYFLGDERVVGWPSPPGNADQIPYRHFSVVGNPGRRLPWYVAYNVDGGELQKVPRGAREWAQDPLVPETSQPANRHFYRSGFDRGYLVARSLVAWGEPHSARIAAGQASFWTNVAPQHEAMNRITYLSVERWEHQMAERHDRLIGFAGPILEPDDPPFRDEQEGKDGFVSYGTFRVPRAFWKVVILAEPGGGVMHRAFRFDNFVEEIPGPEGWPSALATEKPALPGRSRRPETHAVKLETIARETRIRFPEALMASPEIEFTHP